MASVNVSMQVLDGQKGKVVTQQHEALGGRPAFVQLAVVCGWDKEFSLLTSQPALLEEIATEASKLAAWLRSEAPTKLLPEKVNG